MPGRTAVTACTVLLLCAGCGGSTPPAPEAADTSAAATPTAATDVGPASVVLYQGAGIYTVPRTGPGEPTRLSADLPGAEHPDWSPDGTTVVFESAAAAIYTVPSDGAKPPSRVWECTDPCQAVQDAAWSPDGHELAFLTAESTDGTHTSRAAILALDVTSGTTRTVVEDTSGRVWLYHPRWSGDGRSIVYERDVFASRRLDEERVVRFAVVVVPSASGGRPRQVASWPGPATGPGAPAPDWSRDQDLVVYSRADNLHVVSPTGTGDRTITHYDGRTEHAIQPTFAPGGRGIVFTYVAGEFDVDDRPSGAVVGLDGSGLRPLAAGAGMTHPRLSP
ncbi:MAG: hypothetical protein ABI807_09015 [Sporichthyaceae bacterium]